MSLTKFLFGGALALLLSCESPKKEEELYHPEVPSLADASQYPLPSQQHPPRNPLLVNVVDNLVEIKTSLGSGAGFFQDPQTIYTALHVVADNKGNIMPFTISFRGQDYPLLEYSAFISLNADIARIDLREPVHFVHTLYEGSRLDVIVGRQPIEMVSFRQGDFSHSEGYVTALLSTPLGGDRCLLSLETDLKVQRGNSGSPVVSSSTGQVWGIVTLGNFSSQDRNNINAYGMGTISALGNLYSPQCFFRTVFE